MNITVLLDAYPSLSETFLYRTIHIWEKAGMQVNVLARKRGDAHQDIPFQSNVTYLPSESLPAPLKLLNVLYFFCRLCLVPDKLKPALKSLRHMQSLRQKMQLAARCFPLYCHQTELVYFPFGGLAVKYLEYILETNARVIFSLRGSDIHIDPLHSPYRERLKKTLLSASGIHCVCAEIKDRAEQLSGTQLVHAQVIPTSLSLEILEPERPRENARREHDVIKIISVGRLDWRKGFEHGMVAAQNLMQRGVNFQWHIIGEGEYRLALQWAIRDMSLSNHVFLDGPMKHSDLIHELQAADIFFHPSIHEGISNAVLEAMASGLPVVACEVGGMREAIPTGAYGYLVPPRDWKAMADHLEQLAKDAQLRTRMGSAASTLVRCLFTADKQTAGFLELFHRSLAEGRA